MLHTVKLCSSLLQDVVDAKSLCQFKHFLDSLEDRIYTDTYVNSRDSCPKKITGDGG